MKNSLLSTIWGGKPLPAAAVQSRLVGALSSVMISVFAVGCAGPVTPLGALWAVHPSQASQATVSRLASILPLDHLDSSHPSVAFYPARQVLHGPSPLTVVVHEPAGLSGASIEELKTKLVVRHNGFDVTPSFLAQSSLTIDQDRLIIHHPVLRLSPQADHRIEVVYNGTKSVALGRLLPPRCEPLGDRAVYSTERFKPSALLLRQIHESSRAKGFSPVFLAALVAQESGFNSKKVSWAKALGLTQVTAVADAELMNRYPKTKSYPRFPGLADMPYLWVEALVAMDTINGGNEWRLDHRMSLEGGLAYLDMLNGLWSNPENKILIQENFRTDEQEDMKSRLVVASYNSGYARVQDALKRYGHNWLHAPDLKEARHYLARIYSYCEHFGEPEVAHRFSEREPAPKIRQEDRT